MDKILEDIKNIKIQGASEVAKAGLIYIKKIVREGKYKTKKELKRELAKKLDELKNIRPTEPALFNTVSSILMKIEKIKASNIESTKRRIYEICDNKISDIESMVENASKIASREIKNGDIILTHCHSNTLSLAFKKAKESGKSFRVIVTETRPLLQGIKTVKSLLEFDIETIYCVDSAFGYMMKEANKVFVGCDAIFHDGSIANKIGTFPMAVVAKQFGKPFYVVGETIKITEKIEIEERPPNEIINPEKIPGARIINPAFDITPANFITAIMTERGKINPNLIGKVI